MLRPNPLILSYLGAIIAANILVSRYGPTVAVVNSFLFIGLDLTTRDRLHELWQGRALWPRMLALIIAGGLLSLLLGGSGRVALASCLAFSLHPGRHRGHGGLPAPRILQACPRWW